jgi:polysaccharide biosynthesis transport protein
LKKELTLLTKPGLGQEAHHSSISLNDILFAVFKHKGKVLFGAIAGVVAAAAVYFLYPPVYESQAKLLVRYVLDRSPVDEGATGSSYGKSTENVISSEAEILNSWDLAAQVAEAIGPKRLSPELGDAATKTAAATIISSGLEVVTRRGSDIIFVSYKNRDPQLATLVLEELVNRYFTKHLEVHRSAAAFDFVTQQSDQVRARLNQTEDTLKDLKAKAGVTSVADNTMTLSADVVKIEDQYLGAEADLAEQTARVKELEGSLGATGPNDTGANSTRQKHAGKTVGPASPDAAGRKATSEEIQQYQALVGRLTQLHQAQLDMLSRYTPENQLVKLNQSQINNLEQQRRDLEKKVPDLAGQAPAGSSQGQPLDIGGERARLAGIQARTETLKTRLQERIKQLSDVGSQVAALERKKELEEANYKYFQAAVEKARVDEALDPSKMPNISTVQKPSPPQRVVGKRDKIVLMLAGGGAALGLALALLNELILNRTVKRPLELENRLGAPLLVSIPYSPPRNRLRQSSKKSRWNSELVTRSNGRSNVAPWEADHFMRPYAEAIRDRLNLYFEMNRMTHKPKLVGVTGFTDGAGASTLAAGLAAALSEMGEGKVLLVDVNLDGGEVHPFFKGRPAYPLSAALQPAGSIDSASDNLYLATVAPPGAGPMQIALKRFFDLMPNLKASDFDYIIFDMPTLTQTSPTLGMAGFMDKVLLIAEAEKDNRDMVTRGYAQLTAARANVSVVLNKTRSYVPKWLDGDS